MYGFNNSGNYGGFPVKLWNVYCRYVQSSTKYVENVFIRL